MAAVSEISYGKSSLNLNMPPKQGENINLFLRPGDELALGLDLSKAKLQIVGGDVIAFFPNGGQITFVSLGMMAFENNPPYITSPNGTHLSVEQILNAIQDIGQAPRDSILVSGPASLQDIEQQISEQTKSKTQEAPVNDYNSYYVDPQPNIKPQDDIGPKDNSGKYLIEAVTEFTSDKTASADLTGKHDSTENQTKSNIADVSAALSFDIGFYQIKNSDTTDTTAHITTVLGGTGSALGNVSKTASAQFQPETLDYRNDGNKTVITADNALLVNDTYLTKLVRLSVSQPIGFAITDIMVTGLSNGFQILNKDFTSANSVSGGWSLSATTGFTHTPTDGGEIIEFYIRYEPNSASMTQNFDYLMKVNLTSQFDMTNVPLAQQAEVVVPELNTLNTFKDIGVIVKAVNSESDYTYTGRYPNGFVVDTTPNENIIYTSKLDSTVIGGLSNDTIYGNIGNDTLSGNKGNDTLSGGAGENTLDGGDGIDTVSYDFVNKLYSDTFLSAHSTVTDIDPATGLKYANDLHPKGVIVNLQTGVASGKTIYDSQLSDEYNGEALVNITDTLSNVENVIGSKFDDTIIGSDSVANMLHGGEGNDTIDGGSSGGNYLYGEAGNDWLIGSTSDAKIDGGDGTDTVDFSNNLVGVEITLGSSVKDIGSTITAGAIIINVENVAGTQYKDIITGDNSNNLLIGGYNHSLTGIYSDDTITGGAGADTIVGDLMIDSTITLAGYAGNDVLSGGNDNDIIYGDSAPLLGTSTLVVSSDQLREYIVDNGVPLSTVYGGNDTLSGGAGDDYLNGGSGYDTVDYSNSASKVTVILNADSTTAGSAVGEGNDQLWNIENIKGSMFGDTLTGNSLANTIDGNGGSDWVDYSYASGVTVNLTNGTGIVSASDSDTLISIENVLGSSFGDTMAGKSSTANILKGLNGDDIFFSHNDGLDTFDGGNGNDTVDYSLSTGNINVTLGGSNIDTLINIENLIGASGDDILVGDSNNNILDGRSGNDTLIGNAGNDTLIGGSGVDTADYSGSTNAITANLTTGVVSDGFGGTDTLSSIEVLKGSAFADQMTGSASNDTFIGNSGDDTFFASNGNDTYWGYTSGSYNDTNKDTIDYSTSNSFGVDHIVALLSTSTTAGSIRTYDSSNALISTDTAYSVENIVGTAGDDTLTGGSGIVNTLSGGAGDDTLTGNIDGDFLDGGSGATEVNFADYSARTQNLIVDLSAVSKNIYVFGTTPTTTNSDTLSNIQTVSGGSGNDKFTGNSSDNIFIGGAGNDTFTGGAGNDTFIGGTDSTHDSGNDTADYSISLASIDADLTRSSGQVIGNPTLDGTDTLYGIENIIGTNQADTIIGDVNANILTGGAGDDILKGNGGVDQLYGGTGNDTIFGGFDGDYIDGGASTEKNTVDYSDFAANATINLNTGKAYLNSTPTVFDTLVNIQNVVGTSADDILIGKSGMVNTLFGGDGNDILTGNLDGDVLDGGADTTGDTADYSAYTSSTNITVDMGAQSIAQTGSATNKDTFQNIEIIKSGAGADTFTVNTSFDTGSYTLDGGSGVDTIDYGAISESIKVTLNGAVNATVTVGNVDTVVGSGNDDIIKNIEDVKGSKVDDIITGDSLSNKLYGNEGNDTLDGGGGSDIIYGGDGNDVIIGTQDGANDFYYGGTSSTDTGTGDRIDYTAVTANLTLVSGITVTDSANSIGTDILSGIEIFDSGSGNDTLTGGTAGITIYGNLGTDKITGGSGNDLIYGDNVGNTHADGQNTLSGGAGNDTLYAGSAGDSLRGDAGNDTMFGGAGIDTLDYVTNNIAITALLNTGVINGDGSDVVDTATIEILRSGSGADTITGAGTGVLTTIYTGSGNDIINGGALAEKLYGEVGNDTIRGGGGIDTIYGGDGNDLIYGNIDGDTVYGDNGGGNVVGTKDTLDFSDITFATNLVIDMLSGTVKVGAITKSTFREIENITGGAGNDLVYGDTNANTLIGGAGADTIFTSAGIDFIDGGSGIDTVDFSAITTVSINVNLSTLQILNDGYGYAETIQFVENINGGNAATGDTLYGDGKDNIIYGNLGADQLSGNDGNDILYGDNATNSNGAADGHNTLDGGAGNDTLYAGDGGDTLIGGSGNDKLYGGAGADILLGGLGDDTLDGGGGIDIADYRNATAKVVIASINPANPNDTTDLTTGILSGAEGTDIITNTVEVIYGSSGYGDTMTGNANDNTLYGWGGNDTLSGGLGNDVIYGGAGDDTIAGNGGNDTLVGGDIIGTFAGWDTVDYSSDVAGVTVNLSTGTATDGTGGTDTLSGFSRVLGSNYADTITGNVGADELRGNGGDDWFMMTAGNDTIYGGTTSETIGDTVDFINAASSGLIVNLSTNNASGTDFGTNVIYEIENVSGSNFADTITGDGNANILVGRALNDTIFAGVGADIIYGDDNSGALVDGIQTGNDFLYGQDGNDTIYGGLGNDSLWGGNDNDILYGGSGDDYLNGESGINILDGGNGNDSFDLRDSTATNTITGGSGADILNFYYAGSAVTVNLGTLSSNQATGGAGTVNFTDALENISGSGYNDSITGNTLANTIWANNGNDTVYGDGGIDIIYGGAGADKLYGDIANPISNDGGNTLYGGEGDDTLYGGLGNDFLYGDDGGSYATTCNDTFIAISGSDGSDFMDGGQGTDTVDYTAVTNNISVILNGSTNATVTITGGDNDTIVNIENFIGGSGNDYIVGDSVNNSLNGGLGDDILIGGGGNDILTDSSGTNTFAGGAGDDTITGTGAIESWLDYSIDGILQGASTNLSTTIGQAISASRGNDIITGVNNIIGSSYNDIFYGNSSVNTINGGNGDDTIEGYGGNDVLDGGSNTSIGDTVSYYYENKINVTLADGGAATTVQVWNGSNWTTENDTISNFENISGSNSANSGLNSDTIIGNSSANTILGYAGNDSIFGGGGNDYIDGGSDNDTISGGTGIDIILGGNGNDILRGGGTAYNNGSADGSADTLYGNAGDDTLYGMLDGDTLYGGDNASTYNGINDVINYSELAAGSAVYVDINATVGSSLAQLVGTPSVIDTIYGFNSVVGSDGNDTIVGNVNSNFISAGAGNDAIYFSSISTVSSVVNAGSDNVDMGTGDDTLYTFISELTSGDTINGNSGNDTIVFRDGGIINDPTKFSNVSNIEFVQFANVTNTISLDTTKLNDVSLIGGSQDDTFNYAISNFDSHDIINGGTGTNTLSFTSAGTLTDTMLSHISNIQKIQLANGTNTVTVDISNIGGGLATLYASTVGGTNTYNYSLSNLTSADKIVGGGASTTDIIQFLDAGAVADDTRFSGLSFIDQIKLANGTNSFNIGINEAQLSGVSIMGGTGIDTFIYTSAALTGGTTNAKLIGSSNNDILKITGASAVSDTNLAGFTGISTLDLNTYTNSIILGSNATTMGLATIDASSNTTAISINASAMTRAVTINAENVNGGTYTGGTTAGDILNINNTLSDQNASNITAIETINVNADTTFTGNLTGVTTLNITAAKTLTLDASAITGDTTSIVNNGIMFINNAITGSTYSGLTFTGAGALQVNGSGGNDTLNFNANVAGYTGTLTLNGGAGDDIITGTAKNDTLLGGAGNDTLNGGSGSDYLDGGADNDTYRFTALADISADTINDTGGGTDVVFMDAALNFDLSTISVTGVEGLKFYQGATAQTLTISKAQASLYTDYIGSASASDTLIATGVTSSLDMNSGKTYSNISKVVINGSGSTAMTLTGASSVSNSINGGSGDDIIIAGTQADTLLGGSGNDTYQIISTNLTSADTISDSSGTADVLQITDAGATITDTQLTNVTGVKILKLGSGSTATLGTEAYNAGSGFTTVNLSAGGTNVINNSAIANISIIGGAGTDTLNLSGGIAINATNITNVEAINLTGGTSAITGAFTNTLTITIASGATLTDAVAALSAKTVNINGTLTETNIINGLNISNFSLNSGGTANLTLSAGSILDTSTIATKNSGGILKINGSSGAETITVDSAKFGTNASDTITDSGGTDTLIVKGSSAIDFTKIAGMETVDLTNYTGTTLTTNNTTGETVKINSNYTSINTGGGTDQLYITANTVDLSSATLTGIESFYVAVGATLKLSIADVASKAVTGSGNIMVVMDSSSAADLSLITSTGTKTLDITANSIFSGTLGTVSTITIDAGVMATVAASILNGKTATITGAGALDITASSTATNNNFSGLTNTITGDVTLNISSVLDLTAINLGTVLDKINTSASTTLSAGQANVLSKYTGTGNIIVEAGTASVDLSAKTLTGYSGTFTINDGTGAQTLTGTANDDTFNLDNASASLVAGGGDDTINLLSTLASSPSGTIDGGIGTADVLNIAKSGLTINASNITGVETINVNQSTTMTGTLSTTTVHVANAMILSADASVVNGKTIDNLTTNGTVNITNLQNTLNADLSAITTTTKIATWASGNDTFTGNLGTASLAISSGTMTVTDDILSGHVVSGTGAVIVNVDSNLAFAWSNIAASLNETVNFTSAVGAYNQNLANTDAITLASGASVDISGATIGTSTTTVAGAGGNESLTINSSFVHAATTTSIDLFGGTSDSLTLNGSTAMSASDFGKIHGVETLDLTNYAGSADLTSTSGITQLNIGASVNDTTINYAMNIADSGGTDTLHVTANNLDFSGKTISGIETLDLGATTGTTLNVTEADGFNIAGSGTNAFAIAGSTGADTVDLTGNLGAFTGSFSFNGDNGDDHLSLDFSKLSSLSMNGGVNTDTLSLNNITSGSSIGATGLNNISNIETLDISSLSSGNISIDFAALDHIATNANNIDLKLNSAATASLNNLTEVYLSTDTTHTTNLASSGSWTTSNAANYDVIHGTDTFTLHVLTV